MKPMSNCNHTDWMPRTGGRCPKCGEVVLEAQSIAQSSSERLCIYCGQPDTDRQCGANHYHSKCEPSIPLESLPGSSQPEGYTYKSTQATNCAVCGEYKHTPLRNDEMGGYVCLTCIDRELRRLQAMSQRNTH